MKAVIIEKFGPPEVLQICDREKPQVKKDELLVKVKAISLNPLDYKVRNGSMGPLFRLMLPKIVGSDFAGVIEEAGTETAEYKAGERVFGSLSPFKSGACAEYIAVKADQVAPIPDEISYEEAAALPIAGLTALQSLRNLGKVGQNSMVLINGAAGGVALLIDVIAYPEGILWAFLTGAVEGLGAADLVGAVAAARVAPLRPGPAASPCPQPP